MLLQLHNIITGTQKTCEQIVRERTIASDISLIHDNELGGHINSGSNSTVSVRDYYTLVD
ncbi:MAG: hypothetical protein LBK66_11170 [Spirochaetaceae bacterium]|nr:hypothetical protein [Spirochaetaceae bacterium]